MGEGPSNCGSSWRNLHEEILLNQNFVETNVLDRKDSDVISIIYKSEIVIYVRIINAVCTFFALNLWPEVYLPHQI